MRHLLPSLLVAVVLAASCGDDDAETSTGDTTTTSPVSTTSTPTSTTASPATSSAGAVDETDGSTTTVPPRPSTGSAVPPEWPGETFGATPLPDVLIADGTLVTRVSSAATDAAEWLTEVLVTEQPVWEIRMASDGTIVAEEILTPDTGRELVTEVAIYGPTGDRTVVDDHEALYDIAVVAGEESLIVRQEVDSATDTAGVVVVSLETPGQSIPLGDAAGPEFGVTHVDWAAGFGVVTAWADLSELVAYRAVDGEPALPSPTEDLPYNAPPFVTAATLSPDGETVVWAEGPDWGFDPNTGDVAPIPREWRLRSMDLATGELRLDYPVSDVVLGLEDLTISSLHHTGDHVLINRATLIYDEWENLRPLALDLSTEEPDLFELPVAGVATPVPGG